jgi:hypothetical protein
VSRIVASIFDNMLFKKELTCTSYIVIYIGHQQRTSLRNENVDDPMLVICLSFVVPMYVIERRSILFDRMATSWSERGFLCFCHRKQ